MEAKLTLAVDQFFGSRPGTLLNNRAFALIEVGKLQEAVETLGIARQIKDGNYGESTRAATEALLLFRSGKPEVGRRRYQDVVRIFERLNHLEDAARAALMLAREEALAATGQEEVAWKRANELIHRSSSPIVMDLHDRIAREQVSLN